MLRDPRSCGTMPHMPRKRHVDGAASSGSAVPFPAIVRPDDQPGDQAAEHSLPTVRGLPPGRADELRPSRAAHEDALDAALRPRSFDEYIGQHRVVDNLRIFVEAARRRGEALDHVLFCGPPGLGKTTLAHLIAGALGVGIRPIGAPAIEHKGTLASYLTGLGEREVLFIDEIHRLQPIVEEYLYPAMEDYRIDLVIDAGPNARTVQIALNPFTLVGATTRSGPFAGGSRSIADSPLYARGEVDKPGAVVPRRAPWGMIGAWFGAVAGWVAVVARVGRGGGQVPGSVVRRSMSYSSSSPAQPDSCR